jgi:uncharacterized repeat protein (TIGR02543 family)
MPARKLALLFPLIVLTLLAGCDEHTVTYVGGPHTTGAAPVDQNSYEPGDRVTVLPPASMVVATGHTFAGWNTASDGSGTRYLPGDTFTMGDADVKLYAEVLP